MNDKLPYALVLGVATVFSMGAMLLYFGDRFRKQTRAISAVGFLLLAGGLVRELVLLLERNGTPQQFVISWVGISEGTGIHFGISSDLFGIVLSLVATVICLMLVTFIDLFGNYGKVERLCTALAFGLGGSVMVFASATLWTALVGLIFVAAGSFFALGDRWHENAGSADDASNLIFHRIIGLVIAILGGCILIPEANLGISSDEVWSSSPAILTGASFLFFGLILQLRAFPFLGWVSRSPNHALMVHLILCQWFPFLASTTLLVRLAGKFEALGLSDIFGWIALMSGLMTAVCAVMQEKWERVLTSVVPALSCFVFAVILFEGPPTGVTLFLGMGISIVALALFLIISDRHSSNSSLLQAGVIAATFSALGGVGFVGAKGVFEVIWASLEEIPRAVFLGVALLFNILALMKIFWIWRQPQGKAPSPAPAGRVVTVFVLVVASLGVVWLGRLSGGVFESNGDVISSSLVAQFFTAVQEQKQVDVFYTIALAVYFGVFFVGAVLSYWLFVVRAKRPVEASRIQKLIEGGYGSQKFRRLFIGSVSRAVGVVERHLEETLWARILSPRLRKSIQILSHRAVRFDHLILRTGDFVSYQLIHRSARALQFLQNGDLQWYLLIGVSSGFAFYLYWGMSL